MAVSRLFMIGSSVLPVHDQPQRTGRSQLFGRWLYCLLSECLFGQCMFSMYF